MTRVGSSWFGGCPSSFAGGVRRRGGHLAVDSKIVFKTSRHFDFLWLLQEMNEMGLKVSFFILWLSGYYLVIQKCNKCKKQEEEYMYQEKRNAEKRSTVEYVLSAHDVLSAHPLL